ncbi:SAM-dependent methyltransferase [Amycolatopsis pithecellobii]|uniref:Methyltransferase domain-containing protein n=1 Tax=Amycolatopsis pithecellobii TaxID=664692 RepID=A0A6N7Z288_9PSEU|nr:class I SAM-dependent methyltransferase [Amycolatopsis pithecellobii]MTD55713.1 methyltransferase domain-containing protein [Amycolatopsis pithecellobii]
MTDLAVAWDTYSRTKPSRRTTNAAGNTTWFNWTQHPDYGPGEELLAPQPGARILELGCGKGGNIAHLAACGVHATGIDISPAQLDAARERWRQVPALTLLEADALEFLRRGQQQFDAIYSVFGAMWFVDPRILLPAIRDRLTPGGRLVFSHRPPIEGCYGCQSGLIQRGDGQEPFVIRRWDYTADAWIDLLADNGFVDAAAHVVPSPGGQQQTAGTLLAQARNAQ